MKIIVIVLAFIFSFSCQDKKSFLEKEIRRDFKKHLLPMPEVDYAKIMGRVPSSAELALGRMLFSDPVLSRNNDVSCATCHLSNHGFADGNFLTVGALGRGGPHGGNVGKSFARGVLSTDRNFGDDSMGFVTRNRMFRNAISTVNVAFRHNGSNKDGLFWDGRFGNIFFQVLLPIHTSIEMCGDNPVPYKRNPFIKGGVWFKEGVTIDHANSFDYFEGRDLGSFNSSRTTIKGIPTFRPNGTLSIPGRNECLALAIAKLRSIPKYRKLFAKAYSGRKITDRLLAAALGSFIITHVSKNTPFDRFVAGESSLDERQLRGMASFFTPVGKKYRGIPGSGCFNCHSAPLFGGSGFVSLGVRSDSSSPLGRARNVASATGAFFGRIRLQRGVDPGCHIEKTTISKNGYAPDIGRAGGTFKFDDCFKFRVPPLRNVVETFPYFHHGTARGQGFYGKDLRYRSYEALKQVIKYHLRGPIDPRLFSTDKVAKVFYDIFHQKDFFVPFFRQNFVSLEGNKKVVFPINLGNEDIDNLVSFISEGLLDPMSTSRGDLGNDVSHPKRVPSGFLPTISRDDGHQLEIPPNSQDKLTDFK